MKKNKLIEVLIKIDGNPDIFIQNCGMKDIHSLEQFNESIILIYPAGFVTGTCIYHHSDKDTK